MVGLQISPPSIAILRPIRAGVVGGGNVGLAMSQLTTGRVYQRATKTGGGAGKGAGTISVPISLTSVASRIEYRLRDAITGGNPVLQDWTTANTNVPANSTSVICPGVPADAKQYLLDLRANSDSTQVVLGTSPVMMGRIIAASGQSQMVRQFMLIPGYSGTDASLGVAISPFSGMFAAYTDSSAANGGYQSPAWAPPADGGNYGSTFAAEFLRRQVAASGVACGLVGNAVGSTQIAAWQPGQPNNVLLRSILDAVGGFEAFYWHQGGDDAGAGTSLATYKANLDAMFSDVASHNAVFGSNFTKLLTAMATRTSSGAGTTASVQTIRQAQKQWAATNGGIYLEPHDVTLADGAVHQDQAGNITLAQHAHRALLPSLGLTGNDTGATLGTPSRASGSAVVYIPVSLPSGATKLVLMGNAYKRFTVYPAGTLTGALAVSSLTYDSANTRLVLTLSAAPADSQALDVYAFVHPDPSGADYLNDMIRDDRVDGDSITVGRSLEPSTAGPVTCPAIAASGAAPVNTAAPTISGTPQVGQTLTASQGTWSNTPTSYAYQWNRAGTPISGATSSTYVPVSGDIGSTLTVTVTAMNGTGSASATSAATAAVTAAAATGGGTGPAVGDVFLVNFYDSRSGNNAAAESGWNNYDQGTTVAPLALISSTGAASALTAKLVNGTMSSGNTGGKSTGNNSGAFPDDVLVASVFADKNGGTGVGTSSLIDVTFGGLAAGTQWKVEAVGSRTVTTRKEDIAVNGGTVVVADVGYNTAISATFSNVSPVNGNIDLTVTQDGSETFCYLNGARLTRTA